MYKGSMGHLFVAFGTIVGFAYRTARNCREKTINFGFEAAISRYRFIILVLQSLPCALLGEVLQFRV